jgi:hypothetical protein
VRIEGLENLQRRLEKLKVDAKNVSVIVGYTAGYAIYVHENLEARHGAAWNAAYITQKMGVDKKGNAKVTYGWTAEAVAKGYHLKADGTAKKPTPKNPNQQAKYLEQPARMYAREIGDIVIDGVKRGLTLLKALKLGGLFLQRMSMEIVPMDTGHLKTTAFLRENP